MVSTEKFDELINKMQASTSCPDKVPSTQTSGDPEIKEMLADVPLLEIVQCDMGEQGRRSGDRVAFYNCPICGHHDCFSVYLDTNSWSCFSSSNNTGYEGGSLLEYLKARNGWDDREAVAELRRLAGRPREPRCTVRTSGTDEAPNTSKVAEMMKCLREARAEKTGRNDKDFSRLFAKCVYERLRWVPEEKAFRFYGGKVWEKCADHEFAKREAKTFSDALLSYSAELPDGDQKESFAKYVSGYTNTNRREALVRDAKSELIEKREAFDAKPDLLNLKNGTLDLLTFEFREHRASDLQTRIAPTKYDKNAQCPEWERFISEVFEGDTETVRYLQKQFGVALTCDTSQERMHIFYGKTRSGKSTALETMGAMLGNGEGGYALAVQPETLAMKQQRDGGRQSSDVARLAGCRLAIVSEPEKGFLLDAARVKQMTGRDTITARRLYENEFQFVPTFKAFMNTNYLPKVNDQTLFESQRVIVVEFPRHLEPHEQDRGLKDRLKDPRELSGLLNWCLEGLRAYREEGAELPPSVARATEDYSKQADKVGLFFKERLVECEEVLTGGEVYAAYQDWCNSSGHKAEGKQAFFEELRRRGLMFERGKVCGRDQRNVILGFAFK